MGYFFMPEGWFIIFRIVIVCPRCSKMYIIRKPSVELPHQEDQDRQIPREIRCVALEIQAGGLARRSHCNDSAAEEDVGENCVLLALLLHESLTFPPSSSRIRATSQRSAVRNTWLTSVILLCVF
jgi:hypothetical protein